MVSYEHHRAAIRGWWPVLHRQKTQTEENTDRKHTQETHTGNTDRKHRRKTHRENTDRKHRKKTQRENTERKHAEKTQTENTDRKHRQKNTERKHREKTHRQKKHRRKKHTEKKHREKTQRENTERKHREKTQRENRDRKHRESTYRSTTQYYKVPHNTIPYYKAPHAMTLYYKVLHSTLRRSRESSPGSYFQGQRPIREANFLGRPYSKDCDSKCNARSYRADTKHKRSRAQDNVRSNSKSSKFAFRHSFARSTHRILREGSSGKIKMCFSLQRRAIHNFKMYVSLQRRAQKCMKRAHGVGSRPRHTEIIVLPTVSDVRPARSDERVRPSSSKICISPQFWTSNEHEMTRGLRERTENLHFTTVLGVRRARNDERVASAT